MKNNRFDRMWKSITDLDEATLSAHVDTLSLRSMLIDLYNDFCDGLFFNKFEWCSTGFYLDMTKDLNTILNRLFHLDWYLVKSRKVPSVPQDFKKIGVEIIDDEIENITPITDLKKSG